MPSPATTQEVHHVLRAQLADALYCPLSEIEEDITFQALGLDSVLGAELSAVINSRFGLDEKAKVLYEHPTLAQLTAYVTARTNGRAERWLTPEMKEAGDVSMTRDEIWLALRQQVLVVLSDLDESGLQPEQNFHDLGANSLDRMDIVTGTVDELQLSVPTEDLVQAADLGSLTDLLYSRAK